MNENSQDGFSIVRERGERLRAARLAMGLNQTEMAKIGGCNLNTQSRYESGTLPGLDYLLRIGQAGVDWIWVVTGRRAPESLGAAQSLLLEAFDQLDRKTQGAVLNLATDLAGIGTPLIVDDTHTDAGAVHEASKDYRAT